MVWGWVLPDLAEGPRRPLATDCDPMESTQLPIGNSIVYGEHHVWDDTAIGHSFTLEELKVGPSGLHLRNPIAQAWRASTGLGGASETDLYLASALEKVESTACPLCDHSIDKLTLYNDDIESVLGSIERWYWGTVARCGMCGWWLLRRYRGENFHWTLTESVVYNEGIVYRFDIDLISEPVYALRKRLLHGEATFDRISPREMEVLVGSILRDYLDAEVVHVGGPGDEGIDLLLVIGAQRFIVQVKRRLSARKREPVAVVRDLLGTMLVHGVNRGVLATTSHGLSFPARRAAESPHVQKVGLSIDLYNQERLRDILELTDPPEAPWEEIVRREGRHPVAILDELNRRENQ